MTMRPDPTFHASPKLAMEAPPENFAYTLLLSPDFSKPDALAVIDSPARGGVKASLRAKIGRMGKGATIATKLIALTRLIPARAGRCLMKTIAI